MCDLENNKDIICTPDEEECTVLKINKISLKFFENLHIISAGQKAAARCQ